MNITSLLSRANLGESRPAKTYWDKSNFPSLEAQQAAVARSATLCASGTRSSGAVA